MHSRVRLAPSVVAAAGLVAGALSSSTMAQTPPPTTNATSQPAAANVPVTRVALFSSGVGYFEHFGTVSGDGAATLGFKTEQLNDVLKSLVLQDLDGGSVSTVSYPSQDPLGQALKGFQVDLSESPPVAQLLGQLRGAQVLVTRAGGLPQLGGKILGVEARQKPAGEQVVHYTLLNLVTAAGLQSVNLDDATAIQLADPRLQDELNKALLAVAGARDSDKKSVTVNFRGRGERKVRLGYVVQTPVWKTSYRLVVGERPGDASNLQGWAIVENQTDSDWNDVSLSLVSGRPLSFAMDLYQPLYVERPSVALELFEGLAPPKYAEAREQFQRSRAEMPAAASLAAPAPAAAKRRAGRGGGGPGGMAMADEAELSVGGVASSMDAIGSIATRATAGQIGELFEYALSNVTLPRQSSAMVPIVTEPIEVTPLSIFNRDVLARYPLTGARLKNTTDKHLLQGPITVFQGGGYAGDAQVNNVPPGQTRLISYGIDLQTLVDADKLDDTSDVQGVKLSRGTLEIINKRIASRHYRMQNKSDRAKTVVVEHAKMSNWDLVVDAANKPVETTDALYRFEKRLEPGQQDELVVRQENVSSQRLAVIDTDLNTLVWYRGSDRTPEPVRQAIGRAIELRQQQADLDRQIGELQQSNERITQEQNRIRENLRTIRPESEYYGRLVKKLEEQETTLDQSQEKIGTLTETRDAKRAELEAFVKDLNVG